MSDPSDNNNSDAASRIDDLVSAIRNALAADATHEAKANAATACRVILRGLEPAPVRNGAPSSSLAGMLAGTPIGAALGAVGSMPREQILEFIVNGLRSVLSHSAPTYHARPPSPVGHGTGGQS